MSIYEEYFTNNDIDIDSVMDSIAEMIHSGFMKFTKTIVYRQITIPSYAVHNYHLWVSLPNEQIHSIFGISEGMVHDKVSMTFEEDDNYTDLTDFNAAEQSEEIIGRHGFGYLFKCDEDSQEMIFKFIRSDRTVDNMMPSIKEHIMIMYYYLLTGNIDMVYQSIRLLSNEKRNTKAMHMNSERTFYRRVGRIIPFKL